MNVGNLNGAGAARDAEGADPAASDEPAGAPPVTREEMARDAAMALIAARREVAEIPPPAADTAAPSRRKP
ncbi:MULTISPECIES: hypothetical protein [unclassified Sulfitobacter]|uniref:hypothetical protein n=1 Tax=unclassified Sulfitobacter TaxID=196795 RepID=UPI0037465E82